MRDFLVAGVSPDDYDDETSCAPLTDEQRAELAEYLAKLSEILAALPRDGKPETW